jgi:hypothetical protein
MRMSSAKTNRTFPRLTALRQHRLERGITLIRAAVAADLPLTRASLVERNPENARPGEVERLRAAVNSLARREVAKP